MPTIHTYPDADLVAHETEGDGCICGPAIEPVEGEDGYIGWHIIHHSLDCREARE